MLVRDAQGVVSKVAVDTAPAHHYTFGIDFQGDDLWVATAKGVSHGIRMKDERTIGMTITDVLEQFGSVQQVAKKAICAPRALNEAPITALVFAWIAHRPEWCEHPADFRHGQHRR